MKELLFLCHRIPYPPNKGDKIRSFNWLKHLSRSYRVHLGCFVDDPDDLKYLPELGEFCAQLHVVRLDPRWSKIRSLVGLATGQPLTLPYYANRDLAAWVGERLAGGRIDAVLVFSGAMAQFLPARVGIRTRTVCDFVDVDSDKWLQYAGDRRWPMSWIYRREARRLLDYERTVAWRSDAGLFVSEAEAEMFKRLAPEVAERITHVENGVDTDYFRPDESYPSPYPDNPAKRIAFTGAMDYWPNVDAVRWFAEEVLPRVRAQVPDACFSIVGGRPTTEVTKLGAQQGVDVVGAVREIRPYLAHAAVVVAPLRIARGIQNKVLEAMSMAKGVVATPEGFDGIRADPGTHLEVAAGAEAFADAVVGLIADPARAAAMGAQARRLTESRYAWQANLERLNNLLQGESLEIEVGPAMAAAGSAG